MDEPENDIKTYAFYQNDQLLTKKSKSNDEFFSIISQDNLNNIVDSSFLYYTELKFGGEKSVNYIENADNPTNLTNNLIDILKANIIQYCCNQERFNSDSIDKSLLNIKYKNMEQNFKYLGKIASIKNDNTNIYNINNLYNKMNVNFSKIQKSVSDSNNDISHFTANIYEINQCSKIIIQIFNVLQVCHYKILTFIINFTKMYDIFMKKQKMTENQYFSLNSCLINQNQDSIIIFNQFPQNETSKKSENDEIKQFFSSILEKYKKAITFSEENDQNDIQKYFKEEVLSFINELTTVVTSNFKTLTEFKEKVEKIQSKYEIITDKTASHMNIDRSKTDFFWYLLQKCQYSCKSREIIDSIFDFYKKFVRISAKKQIYDEFISIYRMKHEIKEGLSIQKMIDQILKEIHQNGQFFYLKILTQITFKNLIQQEFFPSKIKKLFPIITDESDVDENDISKHEYYYKNISSGFFSSAVFSSNFWYNKNFHFFLLINYNLSLDKKLREREIRIFSKNYSRFIVHSLGNQDDTKILIPYFPSRSLHDILFNQKRRFELTFVDKILIFLEIATAMNDLHQNNEYHGNLNSQSLLMNSKKDVYLVGFSVETFSGYDTTPKSNYYFNPPETLIKNSKEKEESFIKYMQKGDIYSFGVLMYSVITENEPEFKFNKKSREERIEILRNNYFEFLFSDEKTKKIFNEKDFLTDDRGNCWIGIKDIIEKCMKIKPDERFSSFREIIDSIKELLIFERNIEEIEYRFEKAASSSEYRCTFSDIIESYYLGQEKCITDINDIVSNFLSNPNVSDSNSSIKGDVIQSIFETFQIKQDDDFTFIFEDIFDTIINNCIGEFFDHNRTIDYTNNLLSFTDNFVLNSGFALPVSTIDDFIENKNLFDDHFALKWIYFLAKELSFVHSKSLFFGNLSINKIGVFFNDEKKIFFPSMILFYSYYNRTIEKNETNVFNFQRGSTFSNCEYFQKKDIKSFKKIVEKFDVFSEEIFQKFIELDSMNKIVCFIYCHILNTDKEILNDDISVENCLSSSQITFSSIQNISLFFRKNNFFQKNLIINISGILDLINGFLENTISNPGKPIKDNFLKEPIKMNSKSEINEIMKKIEKINFNCSSIFAFLLDRVSIKVEEIPEEEQKAEKPKLLKKFRTLHAKFDTNKKWLKEAIERKISLHELYKRSALFLIQRYILNLHPCFKYKLIIKIQNRVFSQYQDCKLKAEDIKEVAAKLGHNDILTANGDVILYIHPVES